MNRNSENHFANVPKNKMERSTFTMQQGVRTTFNMGDLIPFYVDMDILPGDTMQYDFTAVIRQSTPIYPTMDNSYLDIYFFAIPWRLVWKRTKEFFGENKNGPWAQTTEYLIPQLTTPEGGAQKGTVMDYMGIPINVAGIPFSALPVRAYTLTYNEHFRDQNLIAPITEYDDDTDRTADNVLGELGGKPFKVAKFHDYFTSCLPDAQKGPAVETPIGTTAPVLGNGKSLGLQFMNSSGQLVGTTLKINGSDNNVETFGSLSTYGSDIGTVDTPNASGFKNKSTLGVTTEAENSGLYVDLSNAVSATINAQRLAFATQRILEKDARSGSRYNEVILNHFGVSSPDARQQRPEYLGGKRIPITMNQVAQTSSTDSVSPQGNVSAFSLTSDHDRMFTKSFTEHTIILGLCVARQNHSYNQGLARMWSRRRRLDVYWPSLAHLGEMAVLNKEIYATGTETDNETFGFQERWAEYRTKMNLNTSSFRTTYNLSLDSWHYGDHYLNQPGLNESWINETKDYLDRTLAVTSAVEDQYLMDSIVHIKATRNMPLYSVPGLLDHF